MKKLLARVATKVKMKRREKVLRHPRIKPEIRIAQFAATRQTRSTLLRIQQHRQVKLPNAKMKRSYQPYRTKARWLMLGKMCARR